MESEQPTPEAQLEELDAAVSAVRRASFPPSPWWYFPIVGLLGPALVAWSIGDTGVRIATVAAVVVLLAAQAFHDRRRRLVQMRRSIRSRRQVWLTVLQVLVIMVGGELVRPVAADHPALIAIVSFVGLTAATWLIARMIEGDVDRCEPTSLVGS